MSDIPEGKTPAPKQTEHGFWGPLLRHPITATILAFILTGVLGTYFTKLLDERGAERQAREAARERAIQSVREITDLLYERRTRSEMVASSIWRRADETEVKARKLAYDDLYVRWNTRLQSNLFRIREITTRDNSARYSQFEALHAGSLAPLLRQADACVTLAYDAVLSGSQDAHVRASAVLDECKTRELHGRLLDCSYAFTNGLFVLLRSQERNEEASATLIQDIFESCSKVSQFPAVQFPVPP